MQFGCYPLEVRSVLKRDRKGVDVERRESGEGLGGVEVGEAVIKMYYVRKESIFKRRRKKFKNQQFKTSVMESKNDSTDFSVI